ncbi:transglutaminase-like cysteine peptidase [Niveispirillum fermenti]|uniref:transglutaminase-like cysteine peptidase n=1 Tax=Niveispirillum fermenti TaxID=1233113 RepID=UPI003A86EF24
MPVPAIGWRRRLPPLMALGLLMGLVFFANAPALAVAWEGRMDPLPQYRTYCQTYGARDPGCHISLGGQTDRLAGPDRIGGGGRTTLGMAALVHRQVVGDLIYRTEAEDVWQILGSVGTGMEGDCDDVVMTTIARLVRRGFPRAALRATIVKLPGDGGHHLILAVRMGKAGPKADPKADPKAEMYLDDRHRRPMRADQLVAQGYHFVAQEVPGEQYWRWAARQPSTDLQTAG